MYRIKTGISPQIMNEVVPIRQGTLNLRNPTCFKLFNPRTTNYGLNSVKYLGPIIWNQLPDKLKHISTLLKFKLEIKKVTFEDCPCRICKEYVADLGFI